MYVLSAIYILLLASRSKDVGLILAAVPLPRVLPHVPGTPAIVVTIVDKTVGVAVGT